MTKEEHKDEEITRKRKSSSSSPEYESDDYRTPKRIVRQNLDENENDFLALRLRTISEQELFPLSSSPPSPVMIHQSQQQQQSFSFPLGLLPPTFMHEPQPLHIYGGGGIPAESGSDDGGGGADAAGAALSRPSRARRNPTQTPGPGKSETVPALFPWSTTTRATVHPLNYLLPRHITAIKGEVQCKKCDKQYEMEYDLKDKFLEVGSFIVENKSRMHDRAPSVWMNPPLPACRFCSQENSVKPVIPEKKKQINWLFLLLGQLLGCCTLGQLKYFCKHTKNHRTGAKDRVLYLTYLGLCKQLCPSGPFNR